MTTTSSDRTRPARLSAAARRDISILAASRAVTQFGSMLTLIAVALQLQPRGAGFVSAAMAAELIPSIILAPVAGWLLDRLPNRPLMLAAYLVQAASALGLVLLIDHVAAILILLTLIGSAAAVAGPAQSALVPVAAGPEGAGRAYGYLSTAGTIGFLAGLGAAGFLVQALGPRGALAIDSATYLLEAVGVALLRARRSPRQLADSSVPDPQTPAGVTAPTAPPDLSPEPIEPSSAQDRVRFREGTAAIIGDAVLRVVLPGLAISLLASTVVNVASVFLIVGQLKAPPGVYGVVEATWGIGALIGAWLAGRASSQAAHARSVLLGGIIIGIALSGAGLLVSVPGTIAAWLIGGTANSMQNVGSQALINSRIPTRLHGSAFGAFVSLLQACNVASLLLGSLLVTALGASRTLIVAGCTAGLISLLALSVLKITTGSSRTAQTPLGTPRP